MAQDPNYGLYQEHHAKPAPRHPSGTGVGTPEERTWSALAHLSIFLNLFTGLLGPLVAFAIWMAYRGRSERVAFHARRSLWYQVAWLVILAVGWTVTGILTLVLIGFLLIPVMMMLSLVPFLHAAYAAYKVSRGVDYRYLWAADLLKGRHWVSAPLGGR
ncbi:MAG: DUF4870 domain-containing protein [Actinobacteria bacterium]|nr:DUF4870 domain-containing protein [Actinomycetota bacterium]MCA1739753.1 DUF4870 domain-containing protein [Actinomycetota bacterium]